MSVFFNGRTLVSPTTASRVDDSALVNRNLNIGNNVAYIGSAGAGEPKVAYSFRTPVDARRVLKSGPLLDAIEAAFDPSPETDSPARVVALRVDPATQSSLELLSDAAAPVIDLKSTDFGLPTNGIKVKIENGTNTGKRITAQLGSELYVGDNLARNVMSVVYDGPETTATITITGATVTLHAPAATLVETLALADFPTAAALADRISAAPGFAAEVVDNSNAARTVNGLDFVSAQSVKTTPYTVTANLQAIVDWFNSAGEGLVDAERMAGAGAPPANIGFTFLTGAVTGSATSTDWSDCFDVLQNEDVQWLTPLTADASIHAQATAHVAFMSSVGRKERRALVGGDIGQTTAQVKAAARLINSDRVSQVYPGHYNFDRNGDLVLRPSYMTAALCAAAFGGLPPGTALTNRALRTRGLEVELRNPIDTDDLLLAGVMPVEATETGDRVVQSISTWLIDTKYNRREVSVGWGYDVVSRVLRETIDPITRGRKGSPELIARAFSAAESALSELARPESAGGPGLLVGDEINPPFRGLTITIEADVLRLDVQACVAIPVNYNLITIYAVPFSGTATA